MNRIRCYNAHKEHYSFSSGRTKLYDFYNKPLTVTKYPTKKIGSKIYSSGKLVLPNKFFGESINNDCTLIKLHRVHIINKKQVLWGEAYLLFFKKLDVVEEIKLRFDCTKPICKRLKNKYTKISTHKRISNKKTYSSRKIYLPSNLSNKKIQIIKINIPIEIKYFTYTKFDVFNIKILNRDKGAGFILFYEDKTVETDFVSYKKVRTEKAHEQTITLLRKGKTIQEISKICFIKPNSVWNHVCIGFKKEIIHQQELKEIIVKNGFPRVLEDSTICLEDMRSKQFMHVLGKKIEQTSKLEGTRTDLQRAIRKKTDRWLPINMAEALVLFLDSIRKK